MSIIRVKKDKNYFAASNEPFNDSRLSWEARGVMGYLLSKPDDWQLMFRDLINQGPAGEYKIRNVLKELEELGYLERTRMKDEQGKFYWVSTIYETISRLPTYGLSTRGLPTRGGSRDIPSTEELNTESISTDIEGDGHSNLFDLYESLIGPLTPGIADELGSLEDDYPAMWIEDAFDIAKKNKAKSLKYVTTILSRWNTSGKDNGYKPSGKQSDADRDAIYDRIAKELADANS